LDRVSFSVTGCKAGTWIGVELAEAIADLGGSYGSGTMKEFFWLTAVPLPHAGYVFIYTAFTTELLQIF
jgi:hypothetical protein